MRASTRERIRPARSPPRPPARRAPIARSAPGRDRAHGTRRVVFPAWPDVHTRERAAAPWGRGQSLPTGGRVGIRGVLIWQATLTGLFLLLVGGGLGLPLPEDLTLLARDVSRGHHWLVLLGLLALALYLGLHAWIGRTGLEGEGPVTPQSPRGGKDARD